METAKKQSQFKANLVKTHLYRLSFLPRIRVRDKLRQETKLSDGPGFRIKCGMTYPKAQMIDHNLKNKANLPGAQMNVRAFRKRDYDDSVALRLRKNKAKQSQFQNSALKICLKTPFI